MKKRAGRSHFTRRLVAGIKKQKLYNPDVFLSPNRIDIAAKTTFARAYLEGNTSTWPETVYKEHIRAFNNFYENEPRKTSYQDFKKSFIRTIESVKSSDDWKHKAPVPRNKNYLMNGAHRVAASIVLNDKINTIIPSETYRHNYDYKFFKSNRTKTPKIDEDVLDYITIEYVSLKKKNIFIAIIFPTAEGHRQEAYEHLLRLGEIVNMKTFKHDDFIGKEVIKQLYFNSKNDEWNYGLDFDSAKHKADLCFAGAGDLQVYVIEANLDESTRIKEKQYLRDLWKKDKHSIHITDTIDEANRVVRMFFNENSRRFLKVDRKQEFSSEKMYQMFNEYIQHLPDDVIEREKIAVEGSAVFDLLNMRSGRDIDYISRSDSFALSSESIEEHDIEENRYHSQSIDEILTNPKYYFYYKGYKFVDVLEMLAYKQNRCQHQDPKDISDIAMIKAFFYTNPQYCHVDSPMVTIVVPVYNTPEEYLSTCLDSIRQQDYPNVEIILVDDGSEARTAEWLEVYVKKHSNGESGKIWRLIHQKNQGLSGARNNGYKIARGKYIQFLDADDYFDKKLISTAVFMAEKTNADVVVENFIIKDYETDSEKIALDAKSLPTDKTFNLDDLPDGRMSRIPYNVWSKMFKKDFLDSQNILHDKSLFRAEDILFTYTAIVNTSRIVFMSDAHITYRENLPDSNSSTNDKHPGMSIVAWDKLHKVLVRLDKYEQFRLDFEQSLLGSVRWHFDKLVTNEGKHVLAKDAVDFFHKINLQTINDDAIIIYLAAENVELNQLFNVKNRRMLELEKEIVDLRESLSGVYLELERLQQPGLKLATRKLAGSIKRRLKKDLGKVIKT